MVHDDDTVHCKIFLPNCLLSALPAIYVTIHLSTPSAFLPGSLHFVLLLLLLGGGCTSIQPFAMILIRYLVEEKIILLSQLPSLVFYQNSGLKCVVQMILGGE